MLKEKSIDRVGAVFLLRKDGAALLQLRDKNPNLRHAGRWVPPGGHAEDAEGIEECAKRELFEETGYKCRTLNKLIEFKDVVPGWPEYSLTIFWALYDSIQDVKCNEGQDLQFINRHEIVNGSMPDYLLNIWDNAIEQANLKELHRNE
jgi:8-oxo-dGTP pyrophosphatase MutT (NUDIX family)